MWLEICPKTCWPFHLPTSDWLACFWFCKRITMFCLPWQHRITVLRCKVQTFWVIPLNTKHYFFWSSISRCGIYCVSIFFLVKHQVGFFPQFPWTGQTWAYFWYTEIWIFFRQLVFPEQSLFVPESYWTARTMLTFCVNFPTFKMLNLSTNYATRNTKLSVNICQIQMDFERIV